MVDFDPKTLDRWDAVDDGCPHVIAVADQVLRCENDAGHEPPCSATLYWTQETQT